MSDKKKATEPVVTVTTPAALTLIHTHIPRIDVSAMSVTDVVQNGKVIGQIALKFCLTCRGVYWEQT